MALIQQVKEDFDFVEKLKDADGFQILKFKVSIILRSHGLYDYATNNQTEGSVKTEDWKKLDARAQKIIVTTVTDQALLHLVNCATSKEMWIKLNTIYERDSEQQKCALMQELFSYMYKSDGDIASHIAYLKNIVFRLKVLGSNIENGMLITKILSTLPEKYKVFACAWDSTPTSERTLDNLTARLLTEEAKNEGPHEHVAFRAAERRCFKCNSTKHLAAACRETNQSKRWKGKEVKCFACDKIGHIAKDCKTARWKTRTEYTPCSICKKTNHTDKECYFGRNKQTDDKREEKKDSFLTDIVNSTEWVLDSGSTSHIVKDRSLLEDRKEIETEICSAKKGVVMKATEKGKVNLGRCILQDVFFVPDLRQNLISVDAIVQKEDKSVLKKVMLQC